MTEFYLYAIGLILAASLFVAVPLLLRNRAREYQVSNANVVKQRMSELEDEVAQGLMSEKYKSIALKELKLALYNESIAEESPQETAKRLSHPILLGVLAVPAVVIGILVYFESNQLTGLQEYIDVINSRESLTQRVFNKGEDQVTPDDYAKYALIIRHRLREEPEDPVGWRILGQVQLAIGRIEESIAAYQKALDLVPEDAELRYKYANALMAAGTEESLMRAVNQMEYLVAKDNTNKEYRLLLTVIATQLGNAELAGQNFAMIKSMMSTESNFYQSLITQLRRIGVSEQYLVLENSGTNALHSSSELETQEASNLNQKITSVSINIDLSEEAAQKLPKQGFLIVFAQDADSDMRVPLAVKRMPLSTFPISVTLSTEDAMLPDRTLNTVGRVRVIARISKDSDVMPSAGELQGQIDTLPLKLGDVVSTSLLINKEI